VGRRAVRCASEMNTMRSKLLGKRECRDDNAKMAVKEIGLQNEVWICVARDLNYRWAVVARQQN
jgi:hypothetical protein